MTWTIRTGDAAAVLASMPAESVHCVVTSPPYYGLRDYGVEEQLGLEPTLGEYVDRLVAIMAEVRRVLRPDGTLWLNLGDSYASKPRGSDEGWDKSRLSNPGRLQKAQAASLRRGRRTRGEDAKEKDLLMVPATVALALRADGWWLRSEIIWHKRTPMPESVGDRPTRSHEQIYLLTKSKSYFYDAEAIREPDAGRDHARRVLAGQPSLEPSPGLLPPHRGLRTTAGRDGAGRNRRSVWTLSSQPFPDAHFATFPPALVEPCIRAGTSEHGTCACGAPWRRVVKREVDESRPPARRRALEPEITAAGEGRNGRDSSTFGHHLSSRTIGWKPTCECDAPTSAGRCVVLDPFAGSGTTLMVAERLGRDSLGVELSAEYSALARRRIIADCPLHNDSAEATEAVA